MKTKQPKCKALLAVFTLTLLLSFTPVCSAADNLTDFNTICDWAETTLPDYFAPMGEQTFEASGFLIRYYQNTNTYVGTINGDFYVLGGAFGNEVVYVGTNEYLLNLINPPEASTFAKTFGGTNYDYGYSVQQTADGGYIIAGDTKSSGAGKYDVYLVKTDSSGNESWSKTYGGTDDDKGYSVQQTADGGYIIIGSTESYSAGKNDFYLIKTDSNGNETWARNFGSTDDDAGKSVRQTADGGYIIAGYTKSSGAGSYDVYLVKTDSSGNETWSKTFGGTHWDEGYSVQQTADGGYIIAGYTHPSDAEKGDVYLIKTDSNGNETWAKTFGGADYDSAKSVQQTADGGYIIAGHTKSSGAGKYDVYLIKTDSNGNEAWSKTFGGTDDDSGYSVQQTADGGYIIVGDTVSFGAGGRDAYLIKTDSDGNETWSKTFGGTHYDISYSVQQTADGGYIIVGGTSSSGTGENDVYLIKTDSSGNLNDKQAACIYQGGAWENGQCAFCDSSHLYLCGGSDVCIAASGYWYDYECHTAPMPAPICKLTCSSTGFTYTCGSGSSSSSQHYCYIGNRQYTSSYTVTYGNGHRVTCTSLTCGARLHCTDDTGSSCTMY
jgi:hypothetical protein